MQTLLVINDLWDSFVTTTFDISYLSVWCSLRFPVISAAATRVPSVAEYTLSAHDLLLPVWIFLLMPVGYHFCFCFPCLVVNGLFHIVYLVWCLLRSGTAALETSRYGVNKMKWLQKPMESEYNQLDRSTTHNEWKRKTTVILQ